MPMLMVGCKAEIFSISILLLNMGELELIVEGSCRFGAKPTVASFVVVKFVSSDIRDIVVLRFVVDLVVFLVVVR